MWAMLQAAGGALLKHQAIKWAVIGFAALLFLVPVTNGGLRVFERLMTVNSNISTTLMKNCAERISAFAKMQPGSNVIDRQSGPVVPGAQQQARELNPDYIQLQAECGRFLQYKSTGDMAQPAASGWLDTAWPLLGFVATTIAGLVIIALSLAVAAGAFEVIGSVSGRAATKAGRATAEAVARATRFIAWSLMTAFFATFLLHIINLAVVSHETHDWFYFNVVQPMALYGFSLSLAFFTVYKGLSNAIEHAKAS